MKVDTFPGFSPNARFPPKNRMQQELTPRMVKLYSK